MLGTGAKLAAATLAGGLAWAPMHASAPTVRSHKAPHVRPHVSPPRVVDLDEIAVYRLMQRGPHDAAIADAAARWEHSPFLLRGLLYTESRLQAGAVNENTGATGIGQLTAGGRAGVANLRRARGDRRGFTREMALEAREGIGAAAELLADNQRECGDTWRALARYNTGSCSPRVTRFVRTVEKHANRFRVASGLPPEPPLRRTVRVRAREPQS